jgi:putative hydrolase of the HAD superfamily
MPPAPPRNVIFDFGGVLVRWKPQEIIDGFYRDEDLRVRLRQGVFEHPDWLEMDRGTLSDAEAADRFAARMGRPAAEMRDLLQHVKESLVPMEDTVELVHALAERGVPVYGLSNMSASTFEHLESRHAVWKVFRGIVISGRIRLVKPDARIFAHITESYDLVAAQTAFIDDLEPNVQAAARHGFRGIRFESAAQCREELGDWLQAPGPA